MVKLETGELGWGWGESEPGKSTEKAEISPPRWALTCAPPASAAGLSTDTPPALPCPPQPQLTGEGALRARARVVWARAKLRLDAPPSGTRQKHKSAGKGRGPFLGVEGFGFIPSAPLLRTPCLSSLGSSPRLARVAPSWRKPRRRLAWVPVQPLGLALRPPLPPWGRIGVPKSCRLSAARSLAQVPAGGIWLRAQEGPA